ncbi:holin [Leuconostoc citreum]|uniref:holin n=1 Tax=Leuconostoc citreum TaxID=33964 RepID=UPI00200B5070|nr:holin [Leuconostoc citreum]MCK8605123.1 holin [Leuconostoc citreum]
MTITNFSDVIVSVAVAAITAIAGYAVKYFQSHKQITTVITLLEPLAKDAVTAMQKAGVDKYISGVMKKNGAYAIVQSELAKLGLTAADESLIKNAVERAYAMLINELNNVYPQAQPKSEDEQAKADELAKAEQVLADAQAKVNELQN